jgi:hypothetical protein
LVRRHAGPCSSCSMTRRSHGRRTRLSGHRRVSVRRGRALRRSRGVRLPLRRTTATSARNISGIERYIINIAYASIGSPGIGAVRQRRAASNMWSGRRGIGQNWRPFIEPGVTMLVVIESHLSSPPARYAHRPAPAYWDLVGAGRGLNQNQRHAADAHPACLFCAPLMPGVRSS